MLTTSSPIPSKVLVGSAKYHTLPRKSSSMASGMGKVFRRLLMPIRCLGDAMTILLTSGPLFSPSEFCGSPPATPDQMRLGIRSALVRLRRRTSPIRKLRGT